MTRARSRGQDCVWSGFARRMTEGGRPAGSRGSEAYLFATDLCMQCEIADESIVVKHVSCSGHSSDGWLYSHFMTIILIL